MDVAVAVEVGVAVCVAVEVLVLVAVNVKQGVSSAQSASPEIESGVWLFWVGALLATVPLRQR